MKCRKYQRLLHLNRTGEISEREAEQLRQHLAVCKRCSLELQRIQQVETKIEQLRKAVPAISNPDKLATDIMRQVRADANESRSLNPLDWILDFFGRSAVRYAAVAVIVLVTASFLLQLLTTLEGVYTLEQRIASSDQSTAGSGPIYTVESKSLKEIANSKSVKPLIRDLPCSVSDGSVSVRAKDIESILSTYNLKDLSSLVGSSVLGVDRKTLSKIIDDITTKTEITAHFGREGV